MIVWLKKISDNIYVHEIVYFLSFYIFNNIFNIINTLLIKKVFQEQMIISYFLFYWKDENILELILYSIKIKI